MQEEGEAVQLCLWAGDLCVLKVRKSEPASTRRLAHSRHLWCKRVLPPLLRVLGSSLRWAGQTLIPVGGQTFALAHRRHSPGFAGLETLPFILKTVKFVYREKVFQNFTEAV